MPGTKTHSHTFTVTTNTNKKKKGKMEGKCKKNFYEKQQPTNQPTYK